MRSCFVRVANGKGKSEHEAQMILLPNIDRGFGIYLPLTLAQRWPLGRILRASDTRYAAIFL